jgi:hypothetical protein
MARKIEGRKREGAEAKKKIECRRKRGKKRTPREEERVE